VLERFQKYWHLRLTEAAEVGTLEVASCILGIRHSKEIDIEPAASMDGTTGLGSSRNYDMQRNALIKGLG